MTTISRRKALAALLATGGLIALILALPERLGGWLSRGRSSSGMMGGGRSSPTMMGSVSATEMNTYTEIFARHTEIRRQVEEIPGGVRTTTESDDPTIATRLKTHVAAMYQHVHDGREVQCMSDSLPRLFRNASQYQRQLTVTSKGVVATETSSNPAVVAAIRRHAVEVSGFIEKGMPAMMRGMMG